MKDWTIEALQRRGMIEEIIEQEPFLELLKSGKKIKIYQGFDPTRPSLHLGHLVSLRVLRWFQLQGHRVVFLIGDATALIGDPTGRSQKREMLTREAVAQNMATYKDQAGLILDFDDADNPVEIQQNSRWLLNLTLRDMLPLMAKITVQRLIERDMFQERMRKGEPLFYVETIYPLLQGYDSVAMGVDAELGGRDQLFNMLVGRDLVRDYLGKEKFVITTPLLPGLDGEKMSKTRKNTVDLTAPPFEMFDKIMQVRDDLIVTYFELLTDVPDDELATIRKDAEEDPLGTKERLAFEIVTMLHGGKEAEQAHREFISVRRKRELPEKIPIVKFQLDPSKEKMTIVDLLVSTDPRILPSKSEVRRLIEQKGLRFNGNQIEDAYLSVAINELDGAIIQVGKQRFYKVEVH